MATNRVGSSHASESISVGLTISPPNTEEMDLKPTMTDEEAAIVEGHPLLSNQAYLVTPTLSNPTLQSLLTSPAALQGAQLSLPEGIQIITVSNPTDLLPTQAIVGQSGRIWHVINHDQGIITVGSGTEDKATSADAGDLLEVTEHEGSADIVEAVNSNVDIASILMPPAPQQSLPPGCPAWAARMKNCEVIGDYYRGYVDTEVELDILLTYHKQATMSFWGTRQSPSPAKLSSRFMWKSQYVPWDGIPFVNTGSRAVVMECQYGPRRKGSFAKKQAEQDGAQGEYKQTCPARIYVKKVRKFPEFKIDTNLDKKYLKQAMDKAFADLKQQDITKIGQDRFYVQLPLHSAHEFHDEMPRRATSLLKSVPKSVVTTSPVSAPSITDSIDTKDRLTRLHPMVVQKIREIVAGGEVRVYHVRRLLRMYVCRELCNASSDHNVQRHDLTLFPTVTDLKNQIHQAVKDIENGTLALTAPTVNVEPVDGNMRNGMVQITELNVWPNNAAAPAGPVPETVTVTLTQSPGEDGSHVISRIETHLSDGTTQISSSLTPETAQLLARLNPSMFPPGSLVQLQAPGADTGEINTDSTTLSDTGQLDTTSPYTANIDMEVQESIEQCHGQLSLPAVSTDALQISPLSETSNILTQENHSLAEQSSDLISVTMVPVDADMDEIQTDSCEEDL